MKHLLSTITLLVILCSSSMAQQQSKPFNYGEKWKQVEKQRDNGLPKEALKLVAEIYKQAKLDQQHGHFLRAIIYQIGLTSTYEENSTEKAIEKIDAEIKGTSEPQSQILHSAKAEILWNYYEQNRYVFMNRTATVNYKKEDLATWDLRSIVEAVFKEYQLSLKNEKLLKQTNLAKYDQILSKTDNGRPYRPTLYDFLAHRAIDFFMGEEPSIVKPAVTFYINNSQYISNSSTFSKIGRAHV